MKSLLFTTFSSTLPVVSTLCKSISTEVLSDGLMLVGRPRRMPKKVLLLVLLYCRQTMELVQIVM